MGIFKNQLTVSPMQAKQLLTAIVFLFFFLQNNFGQTLIHANEQRIEARIKALALTGDSASGILRRVAYSNGDIAARKYITSLMQSVGLSVTTDPAGNIIGKRAGKNPALPPISFGSHTDAVPNGGIYDGDLGVIAAIECIQLLNEKQLVTDHPLEVIDFVSEQPALTPTPPLTREFPPHTLTPHTPT